MRMKLIFSKGIFSKLLILIIFTVELKNCPKENGIIKTAKFDLKHGINVIKQSRISIERERGRTFST